MSSPAELMASLSSCAAGCFERAVLDSGCDASDPACTCRAQDTNVADTFCLRLHCSVRDALSATNASFVSCGFEPDTDHTFVPFHVTFFVLAGVVVLMRCMARFSVGLKLWWNDWANFAAMPFAEWEFSAEKFIQLFCTAYIAYGLALKSTGLGTDMWALPHDEITKQLQGVYVLHVLYLVARFLIRVSITFFYLRVFQDPSARRYMWTAFIATIVLTLPLIVCTLVQCIPISYNWLEWDGEHQGQCIIDTRELLWAAGIILLIIDVWIVLVPLLFVAKLRLSTKKKLLASAMFSTGLAILALGAYKLTLIDEYVKRNNPTLGTMPVHTVAGVEICVGVICASMPGLQALLRPFKRNSRGATEAFGFVGPQSRYAVISDDIQNKGFTPTSGAPTTTTATTDEQPHIEMVTTIHQDRGQSSEPESQVHLPVHDPEATDIRDPRYATFQGGS